ncbi:MAG: Atxe2 family lasso peptide isopeptidase [Sphingomonas sp.]
MRSPLMVAAGVVLACLCPLAASAHDRCDGIDWTRVDVGSARRPLTATDLVRLRDIGPLDAEGLAQHLFAFSPDRRRIAFQVRRADPAANLYCLAMVVIDLDHPSRPRFVDTGGRLIRQPVDPAAFPLRRTGVPAVISPQWSADGAAIFFLKNLDGTTQVWRAAADGGDDRPVTHFRNEVLDFRVTPSAIIAKVRGPLDPARNALSAEAREGFHLDDRFMPLRAATPTLTLNKPFDYRVVDTAAPGEGRAATPSEIAQFTTGRQRVALQLAGTASLCTAAAQKRRTGVPASTILAAQCGGSKPIVCPSSRCRDSSGPLWVAQHGSVVRFMRREGWAHEQISVYEWRPGSGRPRRLYTTRDLLIDCQPATPDDLVCLRESSLHPRHLVSIDLRQARATILADPNPQFAQLELGAVERLHLRSSAGLEAFGDVVLPVDYHPGRRYPLIVVQYQSRGFLRGGTGDEFPIQLFANHGFAVLSIQRPAPVGEITRPRTYVDVDRIGLRDFADRRSVLSVVERGVRALIAKGIVEPDAVGITGLSDGSSTVQFAALNSHMFKAAIVSGCCWEPEQTALLGPALSRKYAQIGWPGISARAQAFWSRISIALNARRVAFPILFDEADEEFRGALASYTALREVGKAADFFVYPDESHFKWQPAHRLAVYQRDLDWFDYWLRNILPSDPRRRIDAARWHRMDQRIDRAAAPSRLSSRLPVAHPGLGIQQ